MIRTNLAGAPILVMSRCRGSNPFRVSILVPACTGFAFTNFVFSTLASLSFRRNFDESN